MEGYFDYAATTPPDPAILSYMAEVASEYWANPSSSHSAGRKARLFLERLRADLLQTAGGDSQWYVVFTSGGTESDNLAVVGVAHASLPERDHIIISNVEHPAIRKSADRLAHEGFMVFTAPVDSYGVVDVDWIRGHLSRRTALVSVMMVNNEIGTVQPVAEIGCLCKEAGIPFHTDAVQGFGNLPFSLTALGADLVSVSAHKIYGPRGTGALFIRKDIRIVPHSFGGDQEYGIRSGTENLPGIAGFVRAARMVTEDRDERVPRIRALRDSLVNSLAKDYPEAVLNGPRSGGHPGIAHYFLPDAPSDTWIAGLDALGFQVSSGSACHSGASEPSDTIRAIGAPHELARTAVRLSLGKYSSETGVRALVSSILEIRDRLRSRECR